MHQKSHMLSVTTKKASVKEQLQGTVVHFTASLYGQDVNGPKSGQHDPLK